jgi:(heptosyl)LPS beta-1,4-glucosyltransferase
LPHDSFLQSNSDNEPLSRRSAGWFMQWDNGLPAELVEKLWNDPDAVLRQQTLQDKLRCTVARIDSQTSSFVWKRHTWGGIGRTLRRSLSSSTARRSWLDGRFLWQLGVPTPRPRAFLERRIGPLKSRSYLLTDYVPGTSLYRFMRFGSPSQATILHFARQVAAIWQRMDDVRIQHNDFQTENLLVDLQGKLWLIDLERLCRDQGTGRARRKQISDLERLLHPRNWRANPEAVEVFRREILKTVAGATALAAAGGKDHPLNRSLPLANRESQLVTVLIPCRNAAATIIKCLKSVHDMADEILVVDAGSTDESLNLVREFGGCKIIEAPQLEGAAFAAWAHSHAKHPWVLRILPDEQLSPELARETQYTLAIESNDDAFEVLHTASFRGRWLQHGGFAKKSSVRLYRKDSVRFASRQGRVEVIVPSTRIGRIPFTITREICPSIDQYVTQTIHRAADAARVQSHANHEPTQRSILFDTLRRLFKSLVLQSGWMDGWAGLHACYLSAMAIYIRQSALWEGADSDEQPAIACSKVCQELKVFDLTSSSSFPSAVTRANRSLMDAGHHQSRAA